MGTYLVASDSLANSFYVQVNGGRVWNTLSSKKPLYNPLILDGIAPYPTALTESCQLAVARPEGANHTVRIAIRALSQHFLLWHSCDDHFVLVGLQPCVPMV